MLLYGSRSSRPSLNRGKRNEVRGKKIKIPLFSPHISTLSPLVPLSLRTEMPDQVRHDRKEERTGFLSSLHLSNLLPRTWTRSVGTRNLGATRRNRSFRSPQAQSLFVPLLVRSRSFRPVRAIQPVLRIPDRLSHLPLFIYESIVISNYQVLGKSPPA
jgi:hypothetical protein